MSMHLRHQFSKFFSVLLMRMNSYNPITVLLCTRSSYSGEFKSHETASAQSLHLCKHTLICNNIWSAHERAVSELNTAMSLTTLAARIIVLIRTGARMFRVFVSIFHILSCSKHEPNEICTNKGADTAVCLIMNAMTRQSIVIQQTMI